MDKNNDKSNGIGKTKNKKKSSKWIFPSSVLALYLFLYFIDSAKTLGAIAYAAKLAKSIAPILLIVLFFMFLFNLIDEKRLKKTIEGSPRYLQYLVMVIFGTFSHGPIYAWYPLMKDFREKGISHGSISIFLYARGIKLSLLPMLAIYFGLKYAIVLTLVMAAFSCIQGLLVDAVMKENA